VTTRGHALGQPVLAAAMEIDCGARTDAGCVRENNEDHFGLAPDINLFVLSDGMGGLACGEVASRLAVAAVLEHCRQAETDASLPLMGELLRGVSSAANRLASAVHLANDVVHRTARGNSAGGPAEGMGATIIAARFLEERMSIAHVGDSRAYRLRGPVLERLTQDHSFVAEQVRLGRMSQHEAERSTLQNVLIRALGVEPKVEVDVYEELVQEDDTVLLCSDGLTRELSDTQIAAVLGENGDAQKAAHRLVELARQAGGGDNITAIVLRLAPRPAGALARIGKWFRNRA